MNKSNTSRLFFWILFFGFGLKDSPSYLCHAQESIGNNSADSRDLILSKSKDIVMNNNGTGYLFGIPPIKLDSKYFVPGLKEDDDFETWRAPDVWAKNFPYYLSGFDREGRPIWISEWGRYDISNFVIGDKKSQESFEKYQRQAAYICIKSRLINTTKDRPPLDRHNFIIDFEGLTPEQIANPQVVEYCIKLARKYRKFFERNMHKMVILNVNFVAEILLNLGRPLFGRMLHRIESYGTNKAIYEPQLLKNFPKDQLPEWYGGSKGHKRVYVFG